MTRDLKKAIEEYQKKYYGNGSTAGKFYATDIMQIYDMTEGKTGNNRLYDAISNALQAGFMIGYRKGQRDR